MSSELQRREPPRRDLRRSVLLQKMSRCFLVSVGTTLLSAGVLVALALGAGVPAGPANIIAVCCGIGPSYYANRHWVWGRSGRSDITREIVPFWLLSLAGLVVSTVAVGLVSTMTANWSTSARAVALPFANLSSFASLWLVQFALLDRVLFKPSRPAVATVISPVIASAPEPNAPPPGAPTERKESVAS
jgi:putative flippase GtrA